MSAKKSPKKPAKKKSRTQAGVSIGHRKKPPVKARQRGVWPSAVATPSARLPTRPSRAVKDMRSMQEAPLGAEILEELMSGTSFEEVRRRMGMTHAGLHRCIANFSRYMPQEARALKEGMRGFLSGMVVDDLLFWRPKGRKAELTDVVTKDGVAQVPDIESQKLAVGSYHHAKDSIIKLFGLASQTVEVSQGGTVEPLTTDELKAKAKAIPEVQAAAIALGMLPKNPQSPG